MNQAQELTGTLDHFIYKDADSGFAIGILLKEDASKVTITGHISTLNPGQQIVATGQWTLHPRFGSQFTVTQYQLVTPSTITGIVRYLGSGLIKGIGPAYAQKLVDRFGLSTLDVIEKSPHLLTQVPGIGPKRIETIQAAWIDQKEISQIMVFLQDKYISPAYAIKIYKMYGARSIEIVQANPYRLARDIWGISFTIADGIAQKIGIPLDSSHRITAGILHTINQVSEQGHLYISLEELKSNATALLQLPAPQTEELLRKAFRELHDDQQIIVVTYKDTHFITTSRYYFTEYSSAHILRTLLAQPPLSFDIDAIYQGLRTGAYSHPIELNEDQQKAIINCLQNKVSIITGGPGTGKTTIIKTLLTILQKHSIQYLLAAPTGRAAKRMSETTHTTTHTIHRLLEYDVRTRQFSKNEKNALRAQFIIIDESSMIDISLAYSLLKAIAQSAHIVFIGDSDQLPSVGAGSFLHDLISSGAVPCVRLNTIFRQAQHSMIITNAHKINNGEFPSASSSSHTHDFFIIKEDDPQQLTTHLHKQCASYLHRAHLSWKDAIILTPMNKGAVGTQALNNHMQTVLNPHTSETPAFTKGHTRFLVHDRVMQIRNNYDKNIFNGDMGIITALDQEQQTLEVRFGSQLVPYETAELEELSLAYAITIHKSQGSEFPAVIIPLFMSHYTLLQRNLIYTAVTRAQKLCILVGQYKAIAIAVHNNKSIERITFLAQYLTSSLTGR